MQNEALGTIKISDDVIISCVCGAVMKIPGVHQLTGGITESLSKNLLGIEAGSRGVKLSKTEDELCLDIYVIVDYKVKIPQLAWDIQSVVKKEIEAITDLKVTEVNIHVQGVRPAGEEEVNP